MIRFQWFGVVALLASSIVSSLASPGAAQANAKAAALANSDNKRQFGLSQSQTFIENRGQWDSRVRYFARSKGIDSWITRDSVVFDLHKFVPDSRHGARPLAKFQPVNGKRVGDVVKVSFSGSKPATIEPGRELPGKLNYMIGNDRSKWAIGVRRYAEATAQRIYPGISARYYYDRGMPRYDLIVAPGADPSAVKMHFQGAKSVAMSPSGALRIGTSVGTIEERGLYAYQSEGGSKKQVACRMVAEGKSVAFRVSHYDRSKPLVIDPLVFATFFGGEDQIDPIVENSFTYDAQLFGNLSVALDSAENVVLGGSSLGSAFPHSTGAYQTTHSAYDVCYVAKLNPTATQLVSGTYLGGSGGPVDGFGNVGGDFCNAITLDSSDNVILAGQTYSTNFPTTSSAYQRTVASGSQGSGFVSKVSADGKSLIFSTLLSFTGQAPGTYCSCVGLDPSGNIAVAGTTSSTSFPVSSNAFQKVNGALFNTAFIAKIASDGSSVVSATYLGGEQVSIATALAVDGAGDVAITGTTVDEQYPTTSGAYQSSAPLLGDSDNMAVISEVSPDCSQLLASTYFAAHGQHGGEPDTNASGIALDSSGNIVIAGSTRATGLPVTSGAFQTTLENWAGGGYIAKFSANADSLLACTYLSGSNTISGQDPDGINSVVLDAGDNVIVAGEAQMPTFPTTYDAFQTTNANAFGVGFVAKLDPSLKALIYSSFLGGSGGNQEPDSCTSVVLDEYGRALLVGQTGSTNFPVTPGAYQGTLTASSGATAWFAAKISFDSFPALNGFSLSPTAAIGGNPVTATVSVNNEALTAGDVITITTDGNPAVPQPTNPVVPAGATSVSFSVATHAVSANATVTLTARYGGVSKTASLSIVTATLTGFSILPNSVIQGGNTTGTVTLNANAGPTGNVITIAGTGPAVLPATVTVPAGGRSKTFNISTASVTATVTEHITATFGTTVQNQTLTIAPGVLASLALNPTTVIGGSPSTGTVTLGTAAGAGGAAVNLIGSVAGTVPATASVAASAISANFTITTKAVTVSTSDVVTATLGTASLNKTLTILPAPKLTTFTVSTNTPYMTDAITGTVTLNETVPVSVALVASDSSDGRVVVDSQPVVAAGSSTATFRMHAIQIPNVTGAKGSKSSTVNVALSGVNQTQVISSTTFGVSMLTPSVTTIHAGQTMMLTITSVQPAGYIPLLVNLATSNSTLAPVAATTTIPAGSSSTVISITAPAHVPAQTVVVITVSISSAPVQTINLTVEP